MKLTVPILVACGVDAKAAPKYVDILNELLPLYSINTLLRVAHFLAQTIHESARFTAVREFASGSAYEGRVSLGNTQKGDGIRFAGRGILQITGRANYTAFAKKYGVDCVNHPELLEQPRWAVAAALWFWQSRKLNELCDQDNTLAITKKINGAKNGLKERIELTVRAKKALAPLFADLAKVEPEKLGDAQPDEKKEIAA